MCGIVGQVNTETPVQEEVFFKMRETLAHRGPDGCGAQFLNHGKVALGHRRLSIIDLSEGGKQPMTNEDGTLWITFNGEIYNYVKLREELRKHGHVFHSNSDTEVILHGYEQWGEDVVNKLNGMFALAIWSETSRQLFLARDRFGIKPLYYYKDSDTFIFASELKAILANPRVNHTLDADAVSDFFVYRFIPSPRSIWKEIKKLPPAHTLLWKGNGNPEIQQFWQLPFSDKAETEEQAREHCDALLKEAVQSHLVSDVPVGVFLSGGYDSGAVTHYMHALKYPIESFSIGFKDWEKSEHLTAREVAEYYGTRHHEQILEEEDLMQLEDLAYYYDEPLGGSSFLPTYYVSQLAAKNVKVVLSGDGGDEVFGGYNWHAAIYQQYHQSNTRQSVSKVLHGRKKFLLSGYFDMMSWAGFHYKDMPQLLGDWGAGDFAHKEDVWFYKSALQHQYGAVKAFQLLDFHSFLPEVVLTKVDRASMAHSLEVRVPFLDHRLAEYTMGLSQSTLFQQGTNKKILKNVLKDKLPESVLSKPKRGFGAPVRRGGESGHVDMIRSSGAYKSGVINTKYIEQEVIGKQDRKKIWAVLLFMNWANKWM